MTSNILWEPKNKEQTQLYQFMTSVDCSTYNELYQWSVNHPAQFWEKIWTDNDVIHSQPYHQVVDDPTRMPGATWFDGARLNFAENMLRYRDDNIALSFKGEQQDVESYTTQELYDAVAKVAKTFRQIGLEQGDCVAGVVANSPETIITMLATLSIGAIWSSCSPDFGIEGILSRFSQIKPKLIVTVDAYYYKGQSVDVAQKVETIVSQLPSVKNTVVISYAGKGIDSFCDADRLIDLSSILETSDVPALKFEQLPFDHPIYILYSSGTTGVPKCIVHGAGGTLLQHLKELKLHCDLKRQDTLFYFTTCGWMMWNWMVSGLAVGATVVLFDGNPFYPTVNVLWQLVDDVGISVFGTSAKYLSASEKFGAIPRKTHQLSTLRAILSTGSTLTEANFEYVYRDIKSDLMLSSISGGTDIVSCFVLGNPILPVIKGEIQCRGLGMDVHAIDPKGQSIQDKKGELVCQTAFPSMPVYFWNDATGERYKSAYFDSYPNQWRHGDYITINRNGGVVIWGRSDATLNPGGVRIGTSEIYRVVEKCPDVIDSIVVGKITPNDERVVLFVKMKEKRVLTPDLKKQLRNQIKEDCTPRHVPSTIIAVADIPYTMSGKKVELAVKCIINGQAVPNKESIQNPESLRYFKTE